MHKYTLPRKHLSASSIGLYLSCGHKYYLRYVLNVKMPGAGAASSQGIAAHKTFQVYYDEVINGKAPLTTDQAAEFAVTTFEETIVEKDIPLGGSEKDDSITQIKTVVKTYVDHVAPKVNPRLTEQEIRYESKCGVEVLGYLDLVRGPNPYEPVDATVLADYKITAKKWNESMLINSLQFNLYYLATGIKDVEIHNVTKSTKPVKLNKQVAEDFTSPKQDVASNLRIVRNSFDGNGQHMERLIEGVARGISAGIFLPSDPGHWMCSEKWCEYWPICRGETNSPHN